MRLLTFLVIFAGFYFISCKEQPSQEIANKYPNGDPHIIKYYIINDLKQKVVIKETEYYLGNIKKVEGGFKDGYKHGKWCYWFPNRNKWSEGYFKYGLSHGKFSVWREDGSRNLISSYKFGKPNGLWIFWDHNGRIYKEVYIMNNKNIKEEIF
jgi:antitoxin component YwqK of YwqJK toxin-antitoxin module